jgi:hypothetical protein
MSLPIPGGGGYIQGVGTHSYGVTAEQLQQSQASPLRQGGPPSSSAGPRLPTDYTSSNQYHYEKVSQAEMDKLFEEMNQRNKLIQQEQEAAERNRLAEAQKQSAAESQSLLEGARPPPVAPIMGPEAAAAAAAAALAALGAAALIDQAAAAPAPPEPGPKPAPGPGPTPPPTPAKPTPGGSAPERPGGLVPPPTPDLRPTLDSSLGLYRHLLDTGGFRRRKNNSQFLL